MAITLRMYFLAGSLCALTSALECADQSKTAQEDAREMEIKRSAAMVIVKACNSQVHPQLQQPSSPLAPQASPGTSPDNSENNSAQPSPNGSPITSPGSSPASPRHQALASAGILMYEWPYSGHNKILHRIDSPVNYQNTTVRPIARQGSARELSNFFPGK